MCQGQVDFCVAHLSDCCFDASNCYLIKYYLCSFEFSEKTIIFPKDYAGASEKIDYNLSEMAGKCIDKDRVYAEESSLEILYLAAFLTMVEAFTLRAFAICLVVWYLL